MSYKIRHSLIIPYNEPIKQEDSETQTWGCRQNNPNICKYNNLIGICAFVTDDYICRKPSKSWKKQYNYLKGNIKK